MVIFSWSNLGDFFFSSHSPTPMFCNEYGLVFVVIGENIAGPLDVSRRIVCLLKRGQISAGFVKAKLIVLPP